MDQANGRGIDHDASEIPKKCDLTQLDNRKRDIHKGEDAVYCNRLEYTYSLQGSGEVITIMEEKFTVKGAQDEAVTYLFDLNLDYEFAFASQIKALVRRMDVGGAAGYYRYDPLRCLLDHHCVEAEMIGKN
jgi:hypothetical protein